MAILYAASSLFFLLTWRRLDKEWWTGTKALQRSIESAAPETRMPLVP
jgi:hypothetical protein